MNPHQLKKCLASGLLRYTPPTPKSPDDLHADSGKGAAPQHQEHLKTCCEQRLQQSMPRAEQLRVLEHGRDSGKNSGGKHRHARGASCLPPLLLQCVAPTRAMLSACRCAQALTEVCDSQQTRPVLHCAAASLHLLQDEARRAARHIGDRATPTGHELQLAR